jgi:hypothetical protein
MTENVKAAIQTVLNELENNDILAANWQTMFTTNFLIAMGLRKAKPKIEQIQIISESINYALFNMVKNSDDPTSWVYNDKRKILDQKRAVKSVKTQMKKKGLI